MIKAPDFLKEDDGKSDVTSDDMSTLDELLKAYDEATERVREAEVLLASEKKVFNMLSIDRIPEFLLSHGITKMDLKDGRKVSVKEDISVTIKDEIAFRKWLRDRGEDAIIKVKYNFSDLEGEKLTKLSDYLITNDLDFDIDESIHAQTKKKYFKELLKEMNRLELPEWVSIYDIRKAVIK